MSILRTFVVATSVLFAAAAWADPDPVSVSAAQLRLASAHAVVVDDATGQVLLEKDSDTAAPIASMTKLMTAMVVLDAAQDMDEPLRVTDDDLDTLKHTYSGVAPGALVTRGDLLKLALTASDNHAAHALARNYVGGMPAFLAAVQQKEQSLGLEHTVIGEPTGLSPDNRSSALDMVKIVRAAGTYAQITEITSHAQNVVEVSGRRWTVRNTNHLVGSPGWNILLSKTGFTNEAGRCLSMRIEEAGRTVAVVLMGAVSGSQRAVDALNIRRWLAGEPPVAAVQVAARSSRHHTGGSRHHHMTGRRTHRVAARHAPAADTSADNVPA